MTMAVVAWKMSALGKRARLVGLCIVCVAAAARPSHAEGFLDFLFGAQQNAAPQAQPQVSGGVSFMRPRRHHMADDGTEPATGGGGNKSICVRLCDGYSFPVGTYRGASDRVSHEATCRSECPGAATALYTTSDGGELADAVGVDSHERYSKLPQAFRFQKSVSPSCACHAPGVTQIRSFLRDYTLRRGDAVMTEAGLKVFHGRSAFPYKPADFVSLAKSVDVHKPTLAILYAMQRYSVIYSHKQVQPVRQPEPTSGVLTVSVNSKVLHRSPRSDPTSALSSDRP